MVFMHEFISTIKSPYIERFGPNVGIRNGTFGGYYLFFWTYLRSLENNVIKALSLCLFYINLHKLYILKSFQICFTMAVKPMQTNYFINKKYI